MAKTAMIELADGTVIPILYEDRGVIAIDKPPGWMLAPNHWTRTSRNLQLALESGLRGGDFWARSRNLRFLRFVHRLDAETSGILLLAKNLGVLKVYSDLFQSQRVEKSYLAVVAGRPSRPQWTCTLPLAEHPDRVGLMRIDRRSGKPAETRFRLLAAGPSTALIEALPITGRTHQIRVHLAAENLPVCGDSLYRGNAAGGRLGREKQRLALRAVRLSYPDPFQKKPVCIVAPSDVFAREHGFDCAVLPAYLTCRP